MKKLVFILILLLASINIFSDSHFRLGLSTGIDFSKSSSFNKSRVADFLSLEKAFIMWGLTWEVQIKTLGFGAHYLINEYRSNNTDWLDWIGDLFFLNYHFIKQKKLVDPIIELGVGCAGRVCLEDSVPQAEERIYLSLFFFIGTGLNVNFERFYLGSKIRFRPVITGVPGAPIDEYPLNHVQILFFGGILL